MSVEGDHDEAEPVVARRAWLVFVPVIVFAGLAALFMLRLGAGDASRLPSALIGKPVPAFALPPVDGLGKPGLAAADLRKGGVTVVNVFASWCAPCREEAPALLRLSQQGLPLVGIAYKDRPENTRKFLADDGDPFRAVGADTTGRTGIDFGVYGVPETYVVGADGTVLNKIVGPLTDEAIRGELLPAVARAESAAKTPH